MSAYQSQREEDLKKINSIRKEYDLSNKEDLLKIYARLQSGEISFQTDVGNRFDDTVYRRIEELKQTGQDKDTGKMPRHPETKKHEAKARRVVVLTRKEMRIHRAVLFVLFATAILCLGYFGLYCYDSWKVDQNSSRMARLKENTTINDMYADEEIEVADGDQVKTLRILDQYKSLYNSNKTLIGWLNIADTIIDYPVMQTEDNEFYLSHNSNLEEDRNGALFLDFHCDIKNPGTNFIIYGHNMKSGKMFGSLDRYEDYAYYEKHKEIRFDTLYEEGIYEIMYVFRSHVYKQDEVAFKYYQFFDANSEEEFQSYMKEMEALSLYDTGVEAAYGDHLLTLSTCDYEEQDGRFVVVAKRVK